MNNDFTTLTGQQLLKVAAIRDLTASTYVVRLERGSLTFTPGQCLLLGLPGSGQHREYSIYSAADAPCLEVLVKEVDNGNVSRKLRKCRPGDTLEVEGPVGFFTLPDEDVAGAPVMFVASGTGISPFHSFVSSYPTLNYQLMHGVRTADEAYESGTYDAARYVLCASRDSQGDFTGRVTDYLRQSSLRLDARYYLCGNSAMIDEVYDILAAGGVDADNIKAEVYF